jgi:NADH:ubiquinone oxidoreductase subunit 5 (subunit L)/multisubunit Na+/H+ antiporter MnhA subunit
LFLGAGSVLYRTGKRDMNQLGGLARYMPYTTGTTAVASLSIAGVPPLNGFASKWLIIATCLLTGFRYPLFLVLGLVAMFISLVTLASFLNVLASSFLGRADEKARTEEVPPSMLAPQLVLAALCVLLGVFPQVVLRFVGQAIEGVTALPASGLVASRVWGNLLLTDGAPVAFWAPLAFLAALAILALIAYGIQRAGRAPVRHVPVWYCGEEHDLSTVRYPAGSFYLPFKHAFQGIYPICRVRVPRFPSPIRRLLDFDRWVYNPAVSVIETAADRVSRTHVGTPQIYLLWIVIGAVLVAGIMLLVTG